MRSSDETWSARTFVVEHGDHLWRVGRDDDNGILLRLGLAADPFLARLRASAQPFDISRVTTLPVPPNTCALEDTGARSELGMGDCALMRVGRVYIQRRFARIVLGRCPACTWRAFERAVDAPVQALAPDGSTVAYVMAVAMTEDELDEAIDLGLAADFEAPYVAEGA